jgi:uncharacterized lipoprotein YddW (UPF0748 family)
MANAQEVKPFLTSMALALTLTGLATADIPEPAREFRGVWIASVANIDWPSQPGLTTADQQAELRALLDRAAKMKLNAVIFQVRPTGDALYESPLEPWSEWLTGKQGRPPQPVYDPLAFAITEARKRSLELHAWFNPFRASHPKATSATATNHVTKTHPEWTRRYGKYLWLDPGEPATRDYALRIISDVLRRYDVDGIHLDDYFYPYPEGDADFPDAATYQRYRAGGGKLDRADWRRDNINQFVRELYRTVKTGKPWVKVGISPFGIWKSGTPPGVTGTSAHDALYADSRRWLAEGWLDYFAPQIYWRIREEARPFPKLLDWWASQNRRTRHLWPGLFTSKIADDTKTPWPARELLDQINVARQQPVTGHIHFSMKPLMEDREEIATRLARDEYVEPALIPASPWLAAKPPVAPRVAARPRDRQPGHTVTWLAGDNAPVARWLVQVQYKNLGWVTYILPASQPGCFINEDGKRPASRVVVRAVDRYGNVSPVAVALL